MARIGRFERWWTASSPPMTTLLAGRPASAISSHVCSPPISRAQPRRFIAGADAIGIAEQKAKDLQEQANAFRDLSTSLAVEEQQP